MGRKIRTVLDVREYGWLGATTTLAARFGTLPAAQAVYPHAAALTDTFDWAALVAALAEARSAKRPVTVFIPAGKDTRLSYTVDVWNGVRLIGEGTVYSPLSFGTRLVPAAVFGGGPGLRMPVNSGSGGDDYHHGTQVRNLRVDGFPSHGIAWLGKSSELAYLDDVQVVNCGGDGIRFDNDGTPMRIGAVSLHDNLGAGLRIAHYTSIMNVDHVTGDGNGESLVTIEDVGANTVIHLETIKAERSAAGVIKLRNLDGAHVAIEQLRCLGSGVSANPVILQMRDDMTKQAGTIEVETFRTPYHYNWPAGYNDQINAIQISALDMVRSGLNTKRATTLDPIRGRSEGHRTVLTGVIGTSATTWPHGQDHTPTIDAIVPKGNGTVWQSSPPDATNLYLQASASISAEIVLGRASRLTAFTTLVQRDTFTAADGTNLSGRTPDIGTAWSFGNVWRAQGNKAVPDAGFSRMWKDTTKADVRISATFNLGPGTSAREVYVLFRQSDSSNNWFAGLVYTSSSSQTFQIYKRVANVLARTYLGPVPTNVIAPDTDYAIVAEVRGSYLRFLVDGLLVGEFLLDSHNASATQHGVYIGNRGATPFTSIDNLEVWST